MLGDDEEKVPQRAVSRGWMAAFFDRYGACGFKAVTDTTSDIIVEAANTMGLPPPQLIAPPQQQKQEDAASDKDKTRAEIKRSIVQTKHRIKQKRTEAKRDLDEAKKLRASGKNKSAALRFKAYKAKLVLIQNLEVQVANSQQNLDAIDAREGIAETLAATRSAAKLLKSLRKDVDVDSVAEVMTENEESIRDVEELQGVISKPYETNMDAVQDEDECLAELDNLTVSERYPATPLADPSAAAALPTQPASASASSRKAKSNVSALMQQTD